MRFFFTFRSVSKLRYSPCGDARERLVCVAAAMVALMLVSASFITSWQVAPLASGPALRVAAAAAAAAARSAQLIVLDEAARAGPEPGAPRVILYWNKFYNNADFYVGYGGRPFADCDVSSCITTSNRSALARADAVVFHMLNQIGRLPARRPGHQRYVFFLKEPPTLSAIDARPFRGAFNLTMTYRRDSDVINGYFRLAAGPEPTALPPSRRRSRAVAWLVSHCDTVSGRELYVDRLRQFIDVDVYGACGPLACPTDRGDHRHVCYRQVAAHYHFYLSFENAQCRDYVTEKLALALRHGMVPVVLGASRTDYEALAPPGSFIHVDDFAGPRELAAHLTTLMANATAYGEYFRWRRHRRVADARGWCDLCRYLHERHAPQYYDDIGRWWFEEGRCASGPVVPESEEDIVESPPDT